MASDEGSWSTCDFIDVGGSFAIGEKKTPTSDHLMAELCEMRMQLTMMEAKLREMAEPEPREIRIRLSMMEARLHEIEVECAKRSSIKHVNSPYHESVD